MRAGRTTAQRFWAKVRMGSGCWEWTSPPHENGYGQFGIGGRSLRAHRVSWELHWGAIPDGLCVLHHCDNPICVRPDHLFLGTKLDNSRDAVRKGRVARGTRVHGAKLNDELVEQLRERHVAGELVRDLAREVGMHVATLSAALRGETWGHAGFGGVVVSQPRGRPRKLVLIGQGGQ